MTNKILVAIDKTGLSPLVVDALVQRALPSETEVLLLQVVDPLIYSVPPEMSHGYAPELAARQKESVDEAERTLAEAAKMLSIPGFKVDCRVVEGEIREGIATVASEWSANLIVVTSHARTGVAKFLHRSVAEGVVHRAQCSVLVLKEAAVNAAA